MMLEHTAFSKAFHLSGDWYKRIGGTVFLLLWNLPCIESFRYWAFFNASQAVAVFCRSWLCVVIVRIRAGLPQRNSTSHDKRWKSVALYPFEIQLPLPWHLLKKHDASRRCNLECLFLFGSNIFKTLAEMLAMNDDVDATYVWSRFWRSRRLAIWGFAEWAQPTCFANLLLEQWQRSRPHLMKPDLMLTKLGLTVYPVLY